MLSKNRFGEHFCTSDLDVSDRDTIGQIVKICIFYILLQRKFSHCDFMLNYFGNLSNLKTVKGARSQALLRSDGSIPEHHVRYTMFWTSLVTSNSQWKSFNIDIVDHQMDNIDWKINFVLIDCVTGKENLNGSNIFSSFRLLPEIAWVYCW